MFFCWFDFVDESGYDHIDPTGPSPTNPFGTFTALLEVPNGFNHLVQEPLKASVVIGTLVPYYLNF